MDLSMSLNPYQELQKLFTYSYQPIRDITNAIYDGEQYLEHSFDNLADNGYLPHSVIDEVKSLPIIAETRGEIKTVHDLIDKDIPHYTQDLNNKIEHVLEYSNIPVYQKPQGHTYPENPSNVEINNIQSII